MLFGIADSLVPLHTRRTFPATQAMKYEITCPGGAGESCFLFPRSEVTRPTARPPTLKVRLPFLLRVCLLGGEDGGGGSGARGGGAKREPEMETEDTR